MFNLHTPFFAFLYLLCFSFTDVVTAHQKYQTIDHNATSPQFIEFIYNQPMNGITISGRFVPYKEDYNPMILPYYGRYRGSAEIILTRLSDMRSIRREFREVSFVSTDKCTNFEEFNYQNPINECVLENPLILKPSDYTWTEYSQAEYAEGIFKNAHIMFEKFLPDLGIKIIDYDHDNKNELIIMKPFGYRGGPEFLIYEIADTAKDFSIVYDDPDIIPSNVEFDYDNKLMTYNYSSGACLSNYYYYKAEELEGYKLNKVINIDMLEIKPFCKKTIYLYNTK